ncbi:MAG: hypothetical protein IJH85_04040 [Clostridia bacterium]|nr:hypothetical protein [Clostridia bacterium]
MDAGQMSREELAEKVSVVYRIYQKNIRAADPLVYQITLGARNGVSEEELLSMALETIKKLDFGEIM